uniref:BPTI/Kunitz inhibitor domain-containing protein n=1 Tax=Pseudonaja textilis TaxID=8673 RepID=A0A670ZKV3_PSETE
NSFLLSPLFGMMIIFLQLLCMYPENVCQLPSVCGICKAMFPRFFYNVSTHKCEPFIYGGCGGNKNNFESEDECRRACRFTKGEY